MNSGIIINSRKHVKVGLSILALLLVSLAVACGTSTETPSNESADKLPVQAEQPAVSVASTANFETCTGFLSLEDVRKTAGRSDIDMKAPDIISGSQGLSDSGIMTMCVIEYTTAEIAVGGPTNLQISGPSMTLTVIAFDSDESAEAHYQLILDDFKLTMVNAIPESKIVEGVLADDSYLLTANAQGIGSIIGFITGSDVVQLHSTLSDGQAVLIDSQQLTSLAATVRAILPPAS
jgi:hypothetical protein